MDQEDIRQKMPKWLKHLQENSWELELLISGGAIFSLFQLSDFFIDWVQGMRITNELPGAGIVMLIGMYGLKVLTLGFTLHLILRAYWLALICINYVFPSGIKTQNIHWKKPYRFDKKMGLDLRKQIVSVDKNCGLVMYMSIISAFAIFGMICLTIFSVTLSYFMENLLGVKIAEFFFGLFINLLLLYVLDLITFGLFRKIPYLSYITYPFFRLYDIISFRPIYQHSLWLFSTNVKKLRFVSMALLFAFLALLNTYSSLYKVMHWPNVLDDRDYGHQRASFSSQYDFLFNDAADLHYMDAWNDDKSRPFGLCSKIVTGDLLEIYIRYDKVYDVLIEATHEDPEKRFFGDIIEIRIDDQIVEANWHAASKKNKDIGIMSMIDLQEFDNGEHLVTITMKEKFKELHSVFVNRPSLIVIPFWIDRLSVSNPSDSTF